MNRPSAAVLAVFVALVLIGGTNFVTVRFSNRELPPFWGAGLPFLLAGSLLVGLGLVFIDQLRATVPPAARAALFLPAVAIAVSTVLLKRLPRADPIGANVVAMPCGAGSLFVLALIAHEIPALPSRLEVWTTLGDCGGRRDTGRASLSAPTIGRELVGST